MELKHSLASVYNDQIEFVTMQLEDSPFITLERQVVVTAPEELVQLAQSGQVQILPELVNLLRDRDRAWAAEVMLAALTRREAKIVDSFSTMPDQWWDALGETAYARWHTWLQQTFETLMWDAQNQIFVETLQP